MQPPRGSRPAVSSVSRQRGRQRGYSDKPLFFGIFAIALAVGILLWWLGQRQANTSSVNTGKTQQASPQGKWQSLLVYPKPKAILEFALTEYQRTESGELISTPLTPANLNGRWRMLFFGFTTCPDICPTTLADLKGLAKTLGPQMPELMFVSVDPERDTPQTLRDYVDFFSPDIRTVSSADITALTTFAAQLGAVFGKVPNEDASSYTMDHSASLYLLDPNGALVGLIRPPHDMKAIAADLRAYLPSQLPPADVSVNEGKTP